MICIEIYAIMQYNNVKSINFKGGHTDGLHFLQNNRRNYPIKQGL